MRDLLRELEQEMLRVYGDIGGLLRPGLPRAEVLARISNLPFRISEDVVWLYEWADGIDCKLSILPGCYLLPLDEAMDEFGTLYSMKRMLQRIFFQRYYDCFRFLSDLSDGGYAFGRVDSKSEGKIVRLCIHAEWRLAYGSLSALLRTAVECYRRGVFGDGRMPDFELYFKIARELNPGFEYWDR